MDDLDVHLPGIAIGNTRAFARWLAGAESPIRASLRRFAAHVDTEALLQETLLRVWLAAPSVHTDGRANSLLRLGVTIAKRLALSEVRKRRHISLGEVGDSEPPFTEPRLPDPLLRRHLEQCFGKLPPKPARALELRILARGGEPDEVLAGRAGMKLNTFLKNVGRARSFVAACLAEHGIEVPVS